MTLLSLCAMAATAQETFTDGDFKFTINDENAVTLTAYTGSGGAVTIPGEATLNGKTYPVTAIGNAAFEECISLTSVVIPESVTSIEWAAFGGCLSLTSVEIPNSVTSIGPSAFGGCFSLTSVELPGSITSIEEATFWNCNRLTSVAIPNSVTSIGEGAFGGCTSLADVYVYWQTPLDISSEVFLALTLKNITLHVPEGTEAAYGAADTWKEFRIVTAQSDGDFTFTRNDENAATLTAYTGSGGDVTIPGEATLNGRTYPVTAIGNEAFENCISLTSVVIPNSVTSIGSEAFFSCSGLTSVELPESVTSIEAGVFRRCSALTSVTLPHSVTSIGEASFAGCYSLTSVEIPNSVTSIGESAFSGCSGLTSVELPNSVTSIGAGAFQDCNSLTSVEFPESVTSIGKWAFNNCYELTSVTIPGSVTSIGERAFSECRRLKDMYVSWSTPLNIPADVFSSFVRIEEVTLHVPEGTEAVYGAADTWKDFRIVGDLPPLAVASPEAQKVWSHGGALHVYTPQAERIEVYALTGQRLYASRKEAGPAVLRLTALPRGLLIVRGSTGWTEKVMNSE
jgi:sorbitol-specific phosphotransferase system component IIA